MDLGSVEGWGRSVPADVWPTNDEDAEDFFMDQVIENNGCPFKWLLDFAA